MFKTISRQGNIVLRANRNFSTTKPLNFKVAICGGTGGIGAPLALLLKMNPLITALRIQDIVKHTPGVAADVSHIEYPAHVTGHIGAEGLKEALHCADIVTIPAGVPRKPGMSRDDLFSSNAIVVKTITEAIAHHCPTAMVAIITNPVNTVVPIACEILNQAGKLDTKRIFGVSTLDNVRANTFVAEKLKISPRDVTVPIVGGHSGLTIIPIFSKAHPKVNFPLEEIKALTHRIQEAGTEIVKAKAGTGSATLSMAYAAARFINSLLCAMKGEPNIVECAYIKTNICPTVEYFAGPVVLGKNGVEKVCPLANLSDFEMELLAKAVPELKKDIQKGIDYVKGGCGNKAHERKDPCAGVGGRSGHEIKTEKDSSDRLGNKVQKSSCAKHGDGQLGKSGEKDRDHGESNTKDLCLGHNDDDRGNKDKKHLCEGQQTNRHSDNLEKDPCAKNESAKHRSSCKKDADVDHKKGEHKDSNKTDRCGNQGGGHQDGGLKC